MSTGRQGADRLSLEEASRRLVVMEAHLAKILARLKYAGLLGAEAKLLDVGAAQGQLLIACARRGLAAVGVEPTEYARQVAETLAEREGVGIDIRDGAAESLPFDDGQFDFVHANSVLEHVRDPQVAMNEAARVLRPGGVFWFSAASSMCPRQEEIDGFPLFGWYPDRLKRRIMAWAKERSPARIGHTAMPAIHWFTNRKARRMLREAGFGRVHDRWDLRLGCEGGHTHALALRVIKLPGPARLLADVLVPHCSYAAVRM